MKNYFIVNPGSRTGHGHQLWKTLETKLAAAGMDYEVAFTSGAGDAKRIAEKICAEHPESKRVIVCGGDGTANEAVNGLSGYANITFGYVPTGSSNDLARGLKIPQDPEEALERIIHPTNFTSVDHGIVEFLDAEGGSRKFAVSSGIGYDADICYEADRSSLKKFLNKIHLGKLIYYLLGIKLIFTNKRSEVTVTVDGTQKMHFKGLLFAAAMNTLYEGGGMPMAPEADPTDGKVSVCLLHDISRLKHIRLMPTILNATHVKHKGVTVVTCKTLEIQADRPLVIHTDGEFAGKHDHVRFSCVPEQIRMML